MNVLVVGSSLIDFFVKVEDTDEIELKDNKALFPLGAKIPIDIKLLSLGGNSTNVASALNKLSIRTSLYTYLGSDPLSRHIKEKMEEKNIDLIIDEIDTTTGSLSLIFDFPSDRIIFSHHNHADYAFDESRINEKPDLIFLTSIGSRWEKAYESVLDYAKKAGIPIAFSPGSQQLKNPNETFIRTLHEAKILLCNMDEAKIAGEALGFEAKEDTKEFLLELKSVFEILSVTDGKNGAYAVDKEGNVYKINTAKPEGHEKTGAGDAYAGAFLAGHLMIKPIETSMKWGVLNALGEMRQAGAQTGQLNLETIEKEVEEHTELTVEKL